MRLALATVPFPGSVARAVELACGAIVAAGEASAEIVCFPECFLPGLRGVGHEVEPPVELESAWEEIARAARSEGVAVVLGTERVVDGPLLISALVIGADGTRVGFQDKVQLDPTEEGSYAAGSGRRVFQVGPLTFGVAICHEAWRYPETVRWAAVRGAQLVFVPHFSEAEPGSHRPKEYAESANTFHEKAVLCRAAENTCYVAAVNYASPGSPTTSAVARPDGTLQCFQPYGVEGLLVADIDLSLATGLLAKRLRTE